MKRTLILSTVMLIAAVLFYSAFSFGSNEAVSKTMAIGTVKVCWANTCPSAPETTVINLVDARGNIVGTCTITPQEPCCKITGDFPTGAYHLEYYRPTGVSKCESPVFRYLNGTDITKTICRCP